MFSHFRILLISTIISTFSFALSPGDLALIGYTGDNPDDFEILLLSDLPSGHTIYVTDCGVKADGSIRTGEGNMSYTSTEDILAGSVLFHSDFGGNNVAFSGSGDQAIVYELDTNGNPLYLFAIQADGSEWDADATSAATSALPPGLTEGSTALAFGEQDNYEYTGIVSGTASDLLVAISDSNNWTMSNTRFDLSVESYTVTSGNADGGDVTCNDATACNDGASEACAYAETNEDCAGNCLDGFPADCAGVCGGSTPDLDTDGICDSADTDDDGDTITDDVDCDDADATIGVAAEYYDCAGVCLTDADSDSLCDEVDDCVEDPCGTCGGDGTACMANIFFSEAGEGSGNNKYWEIYNATDAAVDLSLYSLSSCSNGCDAVGQWDYPNNLIFDSGTTVDSGDVFVICNSQSSSEILDQCDLQTTWYYYSTGDDVFALTHVYSGSVIDVVGMVGEAPEAGGWDVAGVAAATKDHTLVRKSSVLSGNSLWADNPDTGEQGSAGDDADDSEWIVYDQNTWDYIGSHTYASVTESCTDGVQNQDETGVDCGGTCSECTTDLCADVTCPAASGDCYVSGVCDPTTGSCLAETFAASGTSCDDGDADTAGDVCDGAGTCSGSAPVVDSTVFISQNCDPQSNYNPDRFAELYNSGDSSVDLTGWTLENIQGGNLQFTWSLSGTIESGEALVCARDNATDQTITPDFTATWSGSSWNGKGGDGSILKDASGTVIDYAVQDDATGKFENGQMVRNASVTTGSDTYEATQWSFTDVSNAVDATPGSHICDLPAVGCSDDSECPGVDTCNVGACVAGSCTTAFAVAGTVCDDGDGFTENDVCSDSGSCGGSALSSVDVTFNLDLSVEGASSPQVRVSYGCLSGCDADYANGTLDIWLGNSWEDMTDTDGDGVWSHTIALATGVDYTYSYKNGGYESPADDQTCFDDPYGSSRHITPGDSDMDLDSVCWNSCSACPDLVPGCTDDTAVNYNPGANQDDGSCLADWPTPDNLYFAEYAEGSSNNKYLEIYNATDAAVDLSGYSLSSCSNGCSGDETAGWTFQYPDNVTFPALTTVAAGDVYVVCHGSADDLIAAECDQTFTYLSNGDDVFALTQMGSGDILDMIGTIGEDPGNGWDVGGVNDATKDHTLVRKSTVTTGNDGYWEASAGSEDDDSEWHVLDQNTWTYLGSHPHDIVLGCMDSSGSNYDSAANVDDGSCITCADVTCSDWETCNVGTCECSASGGDVNTSGTTNVSDIVMLVGWIVGCGQDLTCFTDEQICKGDLSGDGSVNVGDVVSLINIILADRISYDDATSANIILTDNSISIVSDGHVSGVQMTLSHGSNFSLDLVDSYVSEYNTSGNKTTLMVVSIDGSLEQIATYKGSFEVESTILYNSNNEISDINIVNVNSIEVELAGPNPFNPSTSLNIVVANDGFVSVNVYNLVGQKVATLLNGYMNANLNGYPVNFNGSNLASGVYLVRAETAGNVSTQKLMLLK